MALLVDWFIWGRWVHSCAPWSSLASSGVVWFTQACTRCPWVHSWWLGSFACALGVVGFIRGLWVHLRALDSFGVVGFTLAPSGSLSSFARARAVVRVICSSGVHSRARLYLLGSFGVVGFTHVGPGCRWVYLGSLGSFT